MKIERTRNAGRNIVWGVIEKIVSYALPFISRTILIKLLGAEYLGLNSLFTSILTVLSISELGFGTAVVFSMYKPIAEDDRDTICALLNAYRKVYLLIGTIILMAGVMIMPLLPELIKDDIPADINLYILYGIYLFDTVAGYFLFSYKQALFSAHQRNDLISKRSVAFNLIGNVLRIAMLLAFRNYYAYLIITPMITIGMNFANAYLANKYYPELRCGGDISPDQREGIKKRIIGLISFKIYGVIFTSVDTIVISTFLGLIPLAIYNNYYYVQSSIVGFLTILTSSITAGVGNKMVTNTADDNYLDFKNFVFANGWICSWCSVCLVCLYQHFMRTWLGDDLVFPFSTMILMVLYFLLPRITTLTYTYREAAGLWWEDRFRPLIATVVNLSANLILVNLIGMNGVLISTLICTIFINVPWGTIVLFKSYFKRSPVEYFRHILFYLLATFFAAGITYLCCLILPPYGWGYLLVKAAICCVMPNAVFFLFYFRLKEFSYVKNLVDRVISRFCKLLNRRCNR